MSIQLAAILNEISRVVISLRVLATRSVSSDTSFLVKGMFFERFMRVRTTECLCLGWWSVTVGDSSFLVDRHGDREPFSCLVVLVPRKAVEPCDSIWIINLIWGLMELICELNSTTCGLFTHTWLSSTFLNHHLEGLGALERTFSSTCSMTQIGLRWRWLGIPSDKRKRFVGNGCLGIQRNCCRRRTVEVSWYFAWTSWFSLCLLFNSYHGWVFRIQVNSGTMSKDSRISSGSTDKVSIFSRKNALFLTMYLLFWRGDKILVKYFG